MAPMETRPYRAGDRAGLLALSPRVGEGAPTESLWGHPASEADIYLTPYLDHSPETCFVAVRADGAPVGYLVGAAAPAALPPEDQRMADAIRRHRLMLRARPLAFFARSAADAAGAALRRLPSAGELDDPRWPGHLHINLAPEARGTGAGGALVRAWQGALRDRGAGGYAQTLVENDRAVGFFTHLGFRTHGRTPPVPGVRFRGRRVHQQTLVWEP
ncbi:GNAT family N-acetyltransferase [Nocardiopsis coralliicola]